MGTSERQNLWLAVPPAIETTIETKHVIHVPAADGINVAMQSSAEEFATMPPKNGEIEGLLDACGRNPSATLRLAVPDSLSAMVAAITYESGSPRAASSARLPVVTPAPATPSAKAQLGIGTARMTRSRKRQDWKIWSAPIAACAVLAFALVHSGARGGSAQAAALTHPATMVNAAVAAAAQPVSVAVAPAAAVAEAPAPPQAAVGISFRRAVRPESPAGGAPAAAAAIPAGRSLEMARDAARKGDTDTASTLYARAISEGDQPCEAWTERAALEMAAGHSEEALQMYDHALATNARYVPARLGRADANWAAGHKDVAEKQYADIVGSVSSDLYPKRVAERSGGVVVPARVTIVADEAPAAAPAVVAAETH
jgi:hypothetical protein